MLIYNDDKYQFIIKYQKRKVTILNKYIFFISVMRNIKLRIALFFLVKNAYLFLTILWKQNFEIFKFEHKYNNMKKNMNKYKQHHFACLSFVE